MRPTDRTKRLSRSNGSDHCEHDHKAMLRGQSGGRYCPASVASYETHLQLPLVGFAPNDLWSHAREVLETDARVLTVKREPGVSAGVGGAYAAETDEHLSVVVRFEAETDRDARQVAVALHDAALEHVLKSMPPTEPNRGWTSSFGEPVRMTE